VTSQQLTAEALRLSRMISNLGSADYEARRAGLVDLHAHLESEYEVAMDQFRALEAEARSVLRVDDLSSPS